MKNQLKCLPVSLAVVLVSVGVAVTIPTHVSASADVTLYVSPKGSGDACTAAAPCGLVDAVTNYANSDNRLILSPGDYGSPAHPLVATLEAQLGVEFLTIEGMSGKPAPNIFTAAPVGLELDGPHLARLRVYHTGAEAAIETFGYSAMHDVYAVSASGDACRLQEGEVTETACWAQSSSGAHDAIRITPSDENSDIDLDDVTAYSENGVAIECDATGTSSFALMLDNTAAQAHQGEDLQGSAPAGSGSTVTAQFTDWNTDEFYNVNVSIDKSDPKNGPRFLHPGMSLLEAPDSPTVDAGSTQLSDEAEQDLSGLPRVLGRAIDIGALEFTPKPTVKRPIVIDRSRHSIRLHVEISPGGLPGESTVTATAGGRSQSSKRKNFAASHTVRDATLVAGALRAHTRYRLTVRVKTAGGKVTSKHVSAATR